MRKMRESEKTLMCPEVDILHDEENRKVIAQVELPGVSKKNIMLETGNEGFCVKGQRADAIFESCFSFGEHIDAKKTKATFENGLLTLTAPLSRESFQARRLNIS